MVSITNTTARLPALSLEEPHEQWQSPFFSVIPGEVRDKIFAYTLADYEDKSKPYDTTTPYTRPNYFAPRRSDTAILRTCKRVYKEAWFRPWVSAEHTFFLTTIDRHPNKTTSPEEMQLLLYEIHADRGDPVEFEQVRVFPQLFMLEPGARLQEIFDLPGFNPVRVTITIRHTDWWWWELDKPLSIGSHWVKTCRLPSSVREVRMELESLERRKDQIDSIGREMCTKWQFLRKDDVLMVPRAALPGPDPFPVSRWSGPSTWNGERWIRDESRPETVDYYVATVAWAPKIPQIQGCDEVVVEPRPEPVDLVLSGQRKVVMGPAKVKVQRLRDAGVAPGTPADEVRRLLLPLTQVGHHVVGMSRQE